MKPDIQNKKDIDTLVNLFYKKVVTDETIGFIFTKMAHFSFETHIPIMINFWDSVLFGNTNYKGNPMEKHIDLNKSISLTKAHFDQWLFLWEQTIVENFEGNIASQAITRAKNIAALMQFKINGVADSKRLI
jgi:hemoglobin